MPGAEPGLQPRQLAATGGLLLRFILTAAAVARLIRKLMPGVAGAMFGAAAAHHTLIGSVVAHLMAGPR